MKPILTLLAALLLASLAPAGELRTGGTEIVMMPPPWTGNGQCLREMLRRENEWSRVRGSIQSLGYWPWLLNAHFSDEEIRELFAKLKSWDLKIGFEVPVLKARDWGMPQPLQAQLAFDQLQGFTARFRSLGMKDVTWFAFDEPVYAARYAIPASGATVPAAPAIELFGRVKMDPDAARRIAYAASQTAHFIALMRKAHPGARLGDIEPYPALNPDEIETAVNAIQKACAAQGIKGMDFFRLDVDWDLMEQKNFGSWAEVKRIEDFCRSNGIAFGLIYWPADQPRLAAAGKSTDRVWREGIMKQSQAYAAAGGSPDQLVIESWLHVPEHAVPETDRDTFTGAALELLRANGPSIFAK
jgi:hypothetical protein